MSPARLAVAFGSLCLVLVAFAWTNRAKMEPPVRHDAGRTTPTPTPVPPNRSPSQASAGHRLAGVADGTVQYAVIEDPNGTSSLYRLGDEVPGLGRLTGIRPGSATINGTAGTIRLQVAPAQTATITATVRAKPATPTRPLTRSPVSPRRVHTVSASSP